MKKIILLFALMTLVLTLKSNGQTSCSNGTPVTTLRVETLLQAGERTTQVIHDVVVSRTLDGVIVHRINVESITFKGNASLVDETSTAALFDALSLSTVKQAAMAGYPSCPTSCTAPAQVRVEASSCVTRSERGLATRFVSCGIQDCSWRTYNVCCPNGAATPSVSMLAWSRPTQCGATCDNTCP